MFPCKNVLDWWNLIYGFNFIYLLDFLAFLLYKKLNVLKSRLVLLAHLRFPQFLTLISFCKRALFALNFFTCLDIRFFIRCQNSTIYNIIYSYDAFGSLSVNSICKTALYACTIFYLTLSYEYLNPDLFLIFLWQCSMLVSIHFW